MGVGYGGNHIRDVTTKRCTLRHHCDREPNRNFYSRRALELSSLDDSLRRESSRASSKWDDSESYELIGIVTGPRMDASHVKQCLLISFEV